MRTRFEPEVHNKVIVLFNAMFDEALADHKTSFTAGDDMIVADKFNTIVEFMYNFVSEDSKLFGPLYVKAKFYRALALNDQRALWKVIVESAKYLYDDACSAIFKYGIMKYELNEDSVNAIKNKWSKEEAKSEGA